MRLQEILKEDLDWGNGQDKDIYMSLKGLVNKNNGVFKSRNQQWFVTNKIVKVEADRDRRLVKELFGVDIGDGEKLVTVEALARWAEYGSRSLIPVRYGFVMDSIGVVRFYRIGNKGNLRDGASPDPSKTELKWERPKKVNAKHLEKTEAEKKEEFKVALGMSKGNYVGEEGKRMDFGVLTLVAKKYMGESPAGYGHSVSKFWNMYKNEDGNVIYHTGGEGPEKGEKVQGKATVKKHLVSKKGDKVTVVIRPRFKVIENMKAEEVTENTHHRSVRDIYNQIRGEYYVWGEDFVGDDNFELTIEEAGEKYKIFVDSTTIKVEPRFRNKQTYRRAKEIEQELTRFKRIEAEEVTEDKTTNRKAKEAFRAAQDAFGRGDNETGHRLMDKGNKLAKKASKSVTEESLIHKRKGKPTGDNIATLCRVACKDTGKVSSTWKNVTCKRCKEHWDSPYRDKQTISSFNLGRFRH